MVVMTLYLEYLNDLLFGTILQGGAVALVLTAASSVHDATTVCLPKCSLALSFGKGLFHVLFFVCPLSTLVIIFVVSTLLTPLS